MIPGFEAIVEERIKKAQKDGAFENLPGKGRPLALEDPGVPDDLKMAHKILKNAGFLPPEVELKKKIAHTRDLMDTLDPGSPEQAGLGKRLNYLLSKLDAVRGTGPAAALVRDQYRSGLMNTLSRKK
ncbi:MAG TPA: DUF1992 domain-containing protein [Desulfobacteraceae bacterium]|nr:DUF1992 domain-containing protein [Desulfobacteraceae bacterium]